jgi:hypothetical protein
MAEVTWTAQQRLPARPVRRAQPVLIKMVERAPRW